MQLFVDDGVSSRGHRDNILGDFGVSAAGICEHKTYSTMAVIAYASDHKANATTEAKKKNDS